MVFLTSCFVPSSGVAHEWGAPESFRTYHSPSRRAAVRLGTHSEAGADVTFLQLRIDGSIVREGEIPGAMVRAALRDDGTVLAIGDDVFESGLPPARASAWTCVLVSPDPKVMPRIVHTERKTGSWGPHSPTLPRALGVEIDAAGEAFVIEVEDRFKRVARDGPEMGIVELRLDANTGAKLSREETGRSSVGEMPTGGATLDSSIAPAFERVWWRSEVRTSVVPLEVAARPAGLELSDLAISRDSGIVLLFADFEPAPRRIDEERAAVIVFCDAMGAETRRSSFSVSARFGGRDAYRFALCGDGVIRLDSGFIVDRLDASRRWDGPWVDARISELVRSGSADGAKVVFGAEWLSICDADRFERVRIEGAHEGRILDAAIHTDGTVVYVRSRGTGDADVVSMNPDGAVTARRSMTRRDPGFRIAIADEWVVVADGGHVTLFRRSLEPMGEFTPPFVTPGSTRMRVPLVPVFLDDGRLAIASPNGVIARYEPKELRGAR